MNNDTSISSAMLYAFAAIETGCPFIDFTPNVTLKVPVLLELILGINLSFVIFYIPLQDVLDYILISFSSKTARCCAVKNQLVCILLILLPCGCAEMPHVDHVQELNLYEIKKNHPYWWVEKQHIRLTDQHIDELAHYGIKIAEFERTIIYYSMTTRRGRSEVEKAFLIKGKGEYGPFELIVDIDRTITIQEIHIVKNPTNNTGNPVITGDFIEQFLRKDLTFSFELSKESEDVLTAPDKVKPIRSAPITSEKITKELKKWLVIAKMLKRDYPIWTFYQ
ncbi:MAG: inositol-3-phosphate synthase [Candidatus Brocadiaceae bacterium]